MDKILTQEEAESLQRKACYDLDSNYEARTVLKSHELLLDRVRVVEEALTEASHMIYGEYYYDHPTAVKIRSALAVPEPNPTTTN